MRRLFAVLRSVKLAILLIAYLALSGIAVSIIPRAEGFYGSIYFLAPAFLFVANLATCTADRFARELRKGEARRHGPDILHLGLLVLLLGAILGQVAKQMRPDWEGFVRLGEGEAVELPAGKLMRLQSLERERYPDGRPKDWISTVEVSRSGAILVPSFRIRVNHPLRLGALSIYQASFGSERVLELEGPGGESRSLAAGERIDASGGPLMLMSVDLETGTALARDEGPSGPRTLSLAPGSKLGPFTVKGAREVELSGLRASYDPAYPLVIVGLALSALGIFLTFARKLKDLAA